MGIRSSFVILSCCHMAAMKKNESVYNVKFSRKSDLKLKTYGVTV